MLQVLLDELRNCMQYVFNKTVVLAIIQLISGIKILMNNGLVYMNLFFWAARSPDLTSFDF